MTDKKDKSPYYTSKVVKRRIDKVLKENAAIYTRLGVSSTKQEKYEAGVQERKNLRNIRYRDMEFIDFLLKEH